MLKLKDIKIIESKKELEALPEGKLLINTINAHSYNTALKDAFFAEALMNGDALIPDGASIVMACRHHGAGSLMVAGTQPGMVVQTAERIETDVAAIHYRKYAVYPEYL